MSSLVVRRSRLTIDHESLHNGAQGGKNRSGRKLGRVKGEKKGAVWRERDEVSARLISNPPDLFCFRRRFLHGKFLPPQKSFLIQIPSLRKIPFPVRNLLYNSQNSCFMWRLGLCPLRG